MDLLTHTIKQPSLMRNRIDDNPENVAIGFCLGIVFSTAQTKIREMGISD